MVASTIWLGDIWINAIRSFEEVSLPLDGAIMKMARIAHLSRCIKSLDGKLNTLVVVLGQVNLFSSTQ